MRTQVQRGPEPNEIFSEPHHSIGISSAGVPMSDGAPVGDPRLAADVKIKPATIFATASRGDGEARDGSAAEGKTRAGMDDQVDPAEPDITRSSTGEDFEASAGPRGRDGCAGSPDRRSRVFEASVGALGRDGCIGSARLVFRLAGGSMSARKVLCESFVWHGRTNSLRRVQHGTRAVPQAGLHEWQCL